MRLTPRTEFPLSRLSAVYLSQNTAQEVWPLQTKGNGIGWWKEVSRLREIFAKAKGPLCLNDALLRVSVERSLPSNSVCLQQRTEKHSASEWCLRSFFHWVLPLLALKWMKHFQSTHCQWVKLKLRNKVPASFKKSWSRWMGDLLHGFSGLSANRGPKSWTHGGGDLKPGMGGGGRR